MALREQLQRTLGSAYRLERELGGGGMSRVFLAEETALGRRVVIKVLPPEVAAGVNADRFKREIQVAARLQHPHIVPVLSAGEMDGLPYYTMPFVEGESVRARLGRAGAMSVTEVIGILRDVAKALAYAHERGIVHRDIKPDNVLLSGGSATVTDFGIAKAIAAARSHGDGDHPITLTQIGSSIGTPAYMAPEQAAADPTANHRADIYAFGCTAYELLTGRPPFVEKSPQRLLAAQMSDIPESITALRADIPEPLADLVMRCLAKEPDARPQAAQQLVQVLETATSGGTHDAMPPVLLGGQGMLAKALVAYVAAFVFVAVVAKAAIVAIGLPDWVYPGALIVMALGLPVILFTAYVHRTTRRLVTQTPTYTPGGTVATNHGPMATMAMKASPHVSWRRTWMGGVFAVGTFMVLIAAYMTLRALGIGPFGSLFAAGALQRNEKLLVADFENTTADTTIGPVVTDAFRTALAQSRAVLIFQPADLRDVLRRMGRPADTYVDFGVAREIATREGIKAVVLGGVTGIGGNFVLSAQLVSPQTRETLASFRENASGEAELLPAIDRLAKNMRQRMGESLRLVQSTPPLERVTTPSLEALRKYVQGNRVMSFDTDWAKGAALLEEAIALDTGFAMAYRRLAVEYANRNQPDRAAVLLQKAYDHSNRLSDAERYLVLGSYYQRGPRQDIAKSTSAYETLIDLQPEFITALNNVAINYRWQRDFAKAEQYLRRAIALGTAPVVTYNQMTWTLWDQGKRDEAWRHLARFDTVYPGPPDRHVRRAELYAAAFQYDSAATTLLRLQQQRPGDLPVQSLSTMRLTSIARTQGRLREAARLGAQGVALNLQRGAPQVRIAVAADDALIRILFVGDTGRAMSALDKVLAEHPVESLPVATRPYLELVLAYAAAGRVDRAQAYVAAFDRTRATITRFDDAPERRAMLGAIAMAQGRFDEAAREFRASDAGDCMACSLPQLAMALDKAGKPDSALTVYERYFQLDDAFRASIDQFTLALSHRRAGELHESRGDVVKAVEHYQKFTELWRAADPELQPQVAAVRARITRLRDGERWPGRP